MAEWRNLGLDFVTLRVFRAAVEEQSFVKAAEREHLAPSAISRRIAELEGRLGILLLRRHDRGVEPTPAGEVLMNHVAALFDIVETTISDLDALSVGRAGNVRMLANLSSMSAQMPKLLAELDERYPDIDIRLEQANSAESVRAISLGTADIAFVTGSVDVSHLTSFDFSLERLVVILPTDHPLALPAGELRFKDILRHPYIGLSSNLALQQLISQKAQGVAGELRERISAGGFETISKFVARGLGLSIMPERHAREAAQQHCLAIRALAEDWAIRRRQICVRSMSSISPAVKRVLEYILDSRM